MVRSKVHDPGRSWLRTVFSMLVVTAFLSTGTSVFALSWEVGDNGTLGVETTLSYAAGWRLEDPSADLTTQGNTVGNRNFEKGDMINNVFNIGVDADLEFEHIGFFARGRAFYDEVYDDGKFHEKTKDRHRDDIELFDAFVYTNGLKVGSMPVTFRVGRQSISWGESLFMGNSISTAQSPLDGTKGMVPGSELKDRFLPTGAAYGQISNSSSSLTLAGYYKWEWEASRENEYGSFYNYDDSLDLAGTQLATPFGTFPRGADEDADDGGEYGVALRYLADNGIEYGLYYLKYHETAPNVQLGYVPLPGPPWAMPSDYYLKYQEDLDLFAASVVGVIGDVNVGLEVTYRPNYETPDDTMVNLVDAELLQSNLVAMWIPGRLTIGDFVIADASTVAFEWVTQYVLNYDDNELMWSDFSTGGIMSVGFEYFDVAEGLDMKIPLAFKYNPAGQCVGRMAAVNEDSNGFSWGADFTYLRVYKFGIQHSVYFGGHSIWEDRDNVSVNFKYTF